MPITPGRYGAIAAIRTPAAPNENAAIELSIDLADAAGSDLLPSPALAVTARLKTADWVRLAVVGEIPASIEGQNVASAILTVSVRNFQESERLYVDDVALFHLRDDNAGNGSNKSANLPLK
jgi:hypothetical protein